MIFCGTYGSKRKSCNNCRYFMLWGVVYGHCTKHNEDFPAQYSCNKFKKDSVYDVFKQMLVNDIVYDIDVSNSNAGTMFLVHSNRDGITAVGMYCTLRDAMNAIKEDAFK